MSAALIAVLLSLVSACAYAAAAVAQERLASRSAGTGALRMLARGAWWWSVALNASAALLHVVALKYGPLTVVQPLGALTLVAAVPLGARLAGRRVSAVEWRGIGLTLLGLGALLLTASGPAPDDVLSVPEALAVSGATAALIGMLSRPGTRPGLRHATASGIASGVASALTQTVTVAVTDHSGSPLSAQVIGVAVLVAAFAAGGLLLSQTAYRGGLGAPLAVVTLANPVAAAVIGLSLLGERLRGGAGGVLLALTGAGLAAWGVVQLSRATPGRSDEAGAPAAVPAPASAPAAPTGTEAVSAGAVGPEAVGPEAVGAETAGPEAAAPEAAAPRQAAPQAAALEAAAPRQVAPQAAALGAAAPRQVGPVLVPRQPGPGHLTRL